jgi:hypothetical protein
VNCLVGLLASEDEILPSNLAIAQLTRTVGSARLATNTRVGDVLDQLVEADYGLRAAGRRFSE